MRSLSNRIEKVEKEMGPAEGVCIELDGEVFELPPGATSIADVIALAQADEG